MRAKFKTGEQRKFLKSVKYITKSTWTDLAKICGLKPETVRTSLYYEKSTMSNTVLKKLAEIAGVETPKVSLLEDNWGQLKAGKLNFKDIKIKTSSKEFAEFVGIILGDGHLSKDGKMISIHLNRKYESHYARTYISKLLKKLKIPFKFLNRRCYDETDIIIYSKAVNTILEKVGIPKGNKTHNKNTKIPDCIQNNKQLLTCCLRGLFDSDGSVSLARKTLQVYFSNYNTSLLASFNNGLKTLGFNPCLTKKSVILYADQAKLFYKIIGTSNLKNAIKFIYFSKYKKNPNKLNFKKYENLDLPYNGPVAQR